jgi:hypothetical protein
MGVAEGGEAVITDQADVDALAREAVYAAWRLSLLRARPHARLTQAEVAEAMGVPVQVVQRMERHAQTAQLRHIADYCMACGVAPLEVQLLAKPTITERQEGG